MLSGCRHAWRGSAEARDVWGSRAGMAGLPPRLVSGPGSHARAGGYEVPYVGAMRMLVWLAGNPTPLCTLPRDGAIPRTCKLKMLGSPYFFFFHYKR